MFQIGVVPRRFGFLTKIDGVDFVEAYEDKKEVELEGLMIPFLSKGHLIQNKEATGREKDKLDVRQLKGRLDQSCAVLSFPYPTLFPQHILLILQALRYHPGPGRVLWPLGPYA